MGLFDRFSKTFDKFGYDLDGYDRDGYNKDGFDKDGYNSRVTTKMGTTNSIKLKSK